MKITMKNILPCISINMKWFTREQKKLTTIVIKSSSEVYFIHGNKKSMIRLVLKGLNIDSFWGWGTSWWLSCCFVDLFLHKNSMKKKFASLNGRKVKFLKTYLFDSWPKGFVRKDWIDLNNFLLKLNPKIRNGFLEMKKWTVWGSFIKHRIFVNGVSSIQ